MLVIFYPSRKSSFAVRIHYLIFGLVTLVQFVGLNLKTATIVTDVIGIPSEYLIDYRFSLDCFLLVVTISLVFEKYLIVRKEAKLRSRSTPSAIALVTQKQAAEDSKKDKKPNSSKTKGSKIDEPKAETKAQAPEAKATKAQAPKAQAQKAQASIAATSKGTTSQKQEAQKDVQDQPKGKGGKKSKGKKEN